MALSLPCPFGKYLLTRKLALGGMAEIFLAKSRGAEGFQRDVVIKRILPSYSEDEAFVTMFIDEARIAARLHHPNIVQVYDFDKAEDSYYIAMEYVDGRDLRKVLDRGLKVDKPLTPLRAMHIVADIAAGLKHAHLARSDDGWPLNIVHRDVSPHNILIAFGGEAKILDFGIAKAAARSTKTRAGTVKGKCSYMSPEQAKGKPLDGRSDMFALCAIGWEILAGRKLFEGETDFEILNAVLTQEIPPPSALNAAVTPDLDAILLKGLSRDRDGRYPDMAALEKELRNYEFRHARGLDEVAIAPYLADLFADEMPVHHDGPKSDGAPGVSQSDPGTLMLPEERVEVPRPTPSAGPMPAAGPAPLVASAPAGVAPVAAASNSAMPKTVPVGTLQKELEDYLAGGGTGSVTPVSAPPSAPASASPVEPVSPMGTASRGVAASSERKNITLPLPADEVETVLAKGPTPKARELPVTEMTPIAARPAGRRSGRLILMGVLVLVGLAAVAFIATMLLDRDGAEPPAGRSSTPPAVAAPSPVEPPVAATPPAPEPTPPAPAPAAPPPATPPAAKEALAAALSLTVDPAGARVLVDGKPVATPGGQGRVAAGYRIGDEVEVSATAPGRKAFRQKVVLSSAAQTFPVRLERIAEKAPPAVPVGTGFVTINARPWADVFWKGRKVGTTPLRAFEVPAGKQLFVLKNQVASKELPVTVESGRTTSHVVDVR